MKHTQFSRRTFVKTSLVASAAVPLGLRAASEAEGAQLDTAPNRSEEQVKAKLPMGKIGGLEFSRLMLGGNLISGYSHARDLQYVAPLMRFYNTRTKIRETIEIAESHGINAINTFFLDDISVLQEHWKNGGTMKWIAQIRSGDDAGCPDIRVAVDRGATAIQLNGSHAEALVARGKTARIGELMEAIKVEKKLAGVGAHDLRVVVECEKINVDVDFYLKTLHTLDYYTAPRADETGPVGGHENYWCRNPEEVIQFMATVKKPWVAYKILAAGAIHPRQAFPYAVQNGADFILVGMFDWQIPEDAKLAERVFRVTMKPESKRTRPWCG